MEAAPLRNQLMNASCSAPQKEIYFFLLAAPSAVFHNCLLRQVLPASKPRNSINSTSFHWFHFLLFAAATAQPSSIPSIIDSIQFFKFHSINYWRTFRLVFAKFTVIILFFISASFNKWNETKTKKRKFNFLLFVEWNGVCLNGLLLPS